MADQPLPERRRGPIVDYSDEGGALAEERMRELELADKIEREMRQGSKEWQ